MASDAATDRSVEEGRPVQAWISTYLELAAEHDSGVPIAELASLLPPGGGMSEAELSRWLAGRPDLAELRGGWAFAPGRAGAAYLERRARADHYERLARELLDGPLRNTLPWLLCVGITGSAAYGSADPSDDLDFLVIARDGYLWLALLRIFLSLRARAFRAPEGPTPRLCFNYLRDDGAVRAEFAKPQDRLFAREALTARILEGESYYQGLLDSAAWIGEHLPVVYVRRRTATGSAPTERAKAPWSARLANATAFLALAVYLQLAGLRRNAHLRRAGRAEAVFRTTTVPGGLSYASIRFETIRARYRDPTSRPTPPAAIERGSDGGVAHPIPRGR